MQSWYPGTTVRKKELNYLKAIQHIFFVQDINRRWTNYVLTPHQIEWHKDDVALQGYNAKSRVVIKSRNTSFTTSAIISNIMAVPNYPAQVIPFVRLNQERANDLITEAKKLISEMRPIRIRETGEYYPFDPTKVDLGRAGSITFPNGVEFRAFPATASASEIIRGLRIAGSAGIIDESNFIRDYENIFIALSDATAGEDAQGRSAFQMNIGTTLKGSATPFKLWYDKISKLDNKDIKIYRWPVFDPNRVDYSKSFLEQGLQPIVPWHGLDKLENRRLRDVNKLKEEYMCIAVDSEEQFYPSELILSRVNTELENYKACPGVGIYFMGIDVASVNDFFVISIFEKVQEKLIQRFLLYRRQVELPFMQEVCANLIAMWNPIRVRIDANGIGFQMAQALTRRFGSIINPIRGNIKGMEKRQRIPVNEFIHTNHKTLLSDRNIELLNDEMQIVHYSMWDYSYKADSTEEYGHGDITVANALASLPLNYKLLKKPTRIYTNVGHGLEDKEIKENVEQDVEWGFEDDNKNSAKI